MTEQKNKINEFIFGGATYYVPAREYQEADAKALCYPLKENNVLFYEEGQPIILWIDQLKGEYINLLVYDEREDNWFSESVLAENLPLNKIV